MFADAQRLLNCNYIYVESTVVENKADFVDQILGSKQWDSLLLSILNTAQIQRQSRLIKASLINVLCFGLSILYRNIFYFSKILLVNRNTQKLDPKNSKIIKVSVILDKMTETLMILVILGSKLCIFLLTNCIFEK